MRTIAEQLADLGTDQLSIVDATNDPIPLADEDISSTVAAAVVEMIDLLDSSGMQSIRDDISWGIVHAFAKGAERAEKRWDDASYKVKALIDEQDGSEVAATMLEEAIDAAKIAESGLEMCELMRETAIQMYQSAIGRPWSSFTSRLQHNAKRTSASVDGEAYLRARAQKRSEARIPEGQKVIFSGGRMKIDQADANAFADNLFGTLDKILAKLPDMVLVHGNDSQGVDRFAASCAASRNVQQITFNLRRNLGNRAGFFRNEQYLDLNPTCIVALQGNGVLERLVETARARHIPIVDRRGPLCTRPATSRQANAA